MVSVIALHADLIKVMSCKRSCVDHIGLIRFEFQSDWVRWRKCLFDRIGVQVNGTSDGFSP